MAVQTALYLIGPKSVPIISINMYCAHYMISQLKCRAAAQALEVPVVPGLGQLLPQARRDTPNDVADWGQFQRQKSRPQRDGS